MLNHGIPVLIVSKRLGHSKPSITLDVNGHLIPSKQEEAAQLMDDLLSEKRAQTAPELRQNFFGATKKTQNIAISGS